MPQDSHRRKKIRMVRCQLSPLSILSLDLQTTILVILALRGIVLQHANTPIGLFSRYKRKVARLHNVLIVASFEKPSRFTSSVSAEMGREKMSLEPQKVRDEHIVMYFSCSLSSSAVKKALDAAYPTGVPTTLEASLVLVPDPSSDSDQPGKSTSSF